MKYLIDTHTLIWMISKPDNIPDRVMSILSSEGKIYVSVVSLWEIAIKKSIKKLVFDYTIKQISGYCRENEIEIVNIGIKHIEKAEKLPFIHRDPFDRMIISQAMTEKMTIITKDENIQKYDIDTVW